MDDSFFDDEQDRIQRILNEKKRKELEEQYGMIFSDEELDLPPEVEGDWLDCIAEFERQFEDAEPIAIRDYIGNPPIKPLAEIPDEELENELDDLLIMLSKHGIHVGFLSDVEIEEMYRFITEELLDGEMDNIRVEGMIHGFIYEDFHPSDEYDSQLAAEHFLDSLFSWDEQGMKEVLDTDALYDSEGKPITLNEFLASAALFYEQNPIILNVEHIGGQSQVEGDYALIYWRIAWERVPDDLSAGERFERDATLHMKRNGFGGWDVIHFNWSELLDPVV